MQIKKTHFATLIIATILLTTTIVYLGFSASPTSTWHISGGIYPGAPSFTVWKESTTYFAKNQYGQVIHDGTDCTQFFTDVIASIVTAGEGTIYVKAGDYTFTTQPYINGSLADLTIKAEKNAKFINGGTGSGHGVFTLRNFETLRIDGLEVDGRATHTYDYAAGTFGLVIYSCNRTYITNCEIHHCRQAIYPYDTDGQPDYLEISNCYLHDFYSSTSNTQALTTGNAELVIIKNNIIQSVNASAGQGVYVHGEGNTVKILNNHFDNCSQAVDIKTVAVGHEVHCIVDGNYITNTPYLNSPTTQAMTVGQSARVINNVFVMNGKANTYGITVAADCINAEIHNNIFNGSEGKLYYAVRATAGSFATEVDSNIAFDCVHLWYSDGTNGSNIITNNYCYNMSSYPVNMINENYGNLIQENIFNTTYDPNFTGSGVQLCKNNIGWVTENFGSATISASTSVTVNHGLDGTPTCVLITLGTTGAGDYYVNTFTATQFTVHVANSGTYTVYWKAYYQP